MYLHLYCRGIGEAHTPSRTHTHTHTHTQRYWHIAAENYQDQGRTHRAPSTAYAKVLQVSVTWKS